MILFSINSLMYPKLASAVGKIIIQDLKELTTLKPVNQKINVVLDEFNIFTSETIVNLKINRVVLIINVFCHFKQSTT